MGENRSMIRTNERGEGGVKAVRQIGEGFNAWEMQSERVGVGEAGAFPHPSPQRSGHLSRFTPRLVRGVHR
jgi:hypothetical protein